ncbi:MAG: porin [bacterium]|nr:porin [bacterium]
MKKKGTTMGFNKVVLTGLALLAAASLASAQTARKAKPDTTVMELKKQVEYLGSTVNVLNQQLSATKLQIDQMSSTAGQNANAEEQVSVVSDRVNGLDERLLTAESSIAGLSKLKVSGYLQTRFEYFKNIKIDTLPNAADKGADSSWFYVRRGRIKFVYTPSTTSQYCIYPDFSKNTVSLKEAWVTLSEPWTPMGFKLTMGQMNWPFGVEIERSSSVRELPERSTASGKLFKGERDRGVKLSFTPLTKMGPLASLVVDLGVYNGYGIDNSTFPWNDPTKPKDFIARAKADLGVVALTASYYDGNEKTSATSGNYYKGRLGGSLEAYYQFLPIGGTALLAEGVQGIQTGKKVLGGYVMLVQNIGKKFGLAFRADTYDPNTSSDTTLYGGTANDLKYDQTSNLSAALNYWWDDAVRFTLSADRTLYNTDMMIMDQHPKYKTYQTDRLIAQMQIKF